MMAEEQPSKNLCYLTLPIPIVHNNIPGFAMDIGEWLGIHAECYVMNFYIGIDCHMKDKHE